MDENLFDAERFDRDLAHAPVPLTQFREALNHAKELLKERFLKGAPVGRLVRSHAEVVDMLLVRAWRHCLGEQNELALVAVGGYGRGELHPHSDIDLLVLAEPEARERFRERLEVFILFLWDMRLEVGHSVRSVEECVNEAQADITVATNLMESRLLEGPRALYRRMRANTGRDAIWPSRHFFEAKWQEQIARHHKHDDTAYNLEPNVKEGPGGLRDIQMIGWVAKRHFGAETLSDLVEHGFLTPQEYRALLKGQNFLWKVRYGLHVLTNRREDRLLFDHQRTLAELFGYSAMADRLAVEQFMKDYYRTIMELHRLNEMLLQLFQEEILYAEEPAQPRPLNKRFQERNGFIEVSHEQVFKRYPFALLELFLVLCQHPHLKGVRAGTIRLVRNHSYLIDDHFRNDLRCRSLFIEILRQSHGVARELQRMNRYGILAAYLPVFGRIVGQMQHDLFHVYTVDEHTLFVVRNLRRLTLGKHQDEYPLCSRIMGSIPKPEVLYIAALFHDVAKGRGGDHSELGAEDVNHFCQHHLLSHYDTRLASWLVRYHLLMSTTAQRKDISDPEVVNAFAAQVGSQAYLDHLYLLTVADIRATSPSVWNSWKDALLAELYHATRRALRRGLANPIDKDELIAEAQEEARRQLRKKRVSEEAITAFWQRLGEEYFLRYSIDEVVWHSRAVAKDGRPEQPLILLREETERGGTEIFIYMPIRGHQFTTTTGTLEQLGLNIVDARIIPSRDNYTVDSYIVLDESGEPIADPRRLEEIRSTLAARLSHPEAVSHHVQRRVRRQLKHFPIPTRVSFEQDPNKPRTMMEVITSDRPGLLAKIGRALSECGVWLQTAKIATFGERVEDIFYITTHDCQAVTTPEQLECLRATITSLLDAGTPATRAGSSVAPTRGPASG